MSTQDNLLKAKLMRELRILQGELALAEAHFESSLSNARGSYHPATLPGQVHIVKPNAEGAHEKELQVQAASQALAAVGHLEQDFQYAYNGRFGKAAESQARNGGRGSGSEAPPTDLSQNQAQYEQSDNTIKGNPMWDEKTRIERGVTKGKAPKALTAAELLWGKASDSLDKERENNQLSRGLCRKYNF